MSCGVVFVCKWSPDLRLTSRYLRASQRSLRTWQTKARAHRNADTSEHVVHEDVIDMVLSDQVAHQRAVVRPGQRRPRARQSPLCLGLLRPPYAFPPDLLGLLLDVVRELTRILDGRGVR